MRILSVAWTIYDERIDEFVNNCTGGGLVIRNICEYIGRKEESYLMIGMRTFPRMQLGNICLVKTDYDKTQKNIRGHNEEYIQYMTGVFKRVVDEIRPDIVNFHGYGDFAISCIENVCIKYSIKYVVTEHLFVCRNKAFTGYEQAIKDESRLYKIPDVHVIAVSNGMKSKIMKEYPSLKGDQIKVILNGTDFVPKHINSDLKTKYGAAGKKILICVGTITDRKNQLQLVRVFAKDKNLKDKISIIFCGRDTMNGKLQQEIQYYGLENCLKYVGALSSLEMNTYYSAVDGLIMPSYAEGLSIAALEAIAYGLPIILFKDSECAEDLKDPEVVCLATKRTDESLTDAIWDWYFKKWDDNYIRTFSKFFSMERMADDYINFYNDEVCNND